jgi:energy-coupling factor transport system ATP-binding protein
MSFVNSETAFSSGNEEALAVAARGLTFTYSGAQAPALRDLTLTVRSGAFSAIAGASGAGKSTLCLTMNGLVPKFVRGDLVGELRVLGVRIEDVPVHEMASSVGMVLQDFEVQLFSTSAELEVAFGLENLGVPRDQMISRVGVALKEVGLAGFEKRDPSTLSGGEKQRLALAAVLAMDPQLLVLDEPTSDLDPQGVRDVMGLAISLTKRGRTVLVAEHETDELLDADSVLVLGEGRRSLAGTPEEVFAHPERVEVAGVRPPQLARLREFLDLEELPGSVVDAHDALRDAGYSVDPARNEALPMYEPAPPDAGAAVRLCGLSHIYGGGIEAIKDISLDIKEGEFVAILGANGSGKTTMVKHLNGLLLPSSGAVEVRGLDTRRAALSAISGHVGYVFQNPDHQIFSETVLEELAFGPRNAGLGKEEIAERSQRALAAVHMEDKAEADPFALTKGERQRVALASVLVMEPGVIVMDEPTTGLDYTQQKQVMALLSELNRTGHTIIIVTHSLWLAARHARRIVVMQGGRIVADGPTRTVLRMVERLQGWSLVPPPALALAGELGCAALTVEELVFCLGANPRRGSGGLGPPAGPGHGGSPNETGGAGYRKKPGGTSTPKEPGGGDSPAESGGSGP